MIKPKSHIICHELKNPFFKSNVFGKIDAEGHDHPKIRTFEITKIFDFFQNHQNTRVPQN